jgi:hypothetical protein
MHNSIGQESKRFQEISAMLRESPLTALREMLPDREILAACDAAGHRFRRRFYDPIVTVLHFLLAAIQREESFAATWQRLWTRVASEFGLDGRAFNSAALAQARSRLPKAVFDKLLVQACAVSEEQFSTWRGLRLLVIDSTTVSMPRDQALFAHFGAHKARTTTVRYPLATFCALVCVGTGLVVDYRFGPFDPGELETATPLLANLRPGDLALCDRRFAGSPTLARTYSTGADFLMRKHARLRPDRLPVIERLGRHDIVTDIPMSKPARKKDPSLPRSVRVRLFKARWTAPSGEKIEEWFVTSLQDAERFPPKVLANLYHRRWRIETTYAEFKVFFHADILRSKTVDNIEKEFAAHVLAYQLIRRLIVEAAKAHDKKPTEISALNAARWVLDFSAQMSSAPAWKLPLMYERLLAAIASTPIDVRPGRIEPRALTREWKHYPHLRISRSQWREQHFKETA